MSLVDTMHIQYQLTFAIISNNPDNILSVTGGGEECQKFPDPELYLCSHPPAGHLSGHHR